MTRNGVRRGAGYKAPQAEWPGMNRGPTVAVSHDGGLSWH